MSSAELRQIVADTERKMLEQIKGFFIELNNAWDCEKDKTIYRDGFMEVPFENDPPLRESKGEVYVTLELRLPGKLFSCVRVSVQFERKESKIVAKFQGLSANLPDDSMLIIKRIEEAIKREVIKGDGIHTLMIEYNATNP